MAQTRFLFKTATISAGQALSDVIDCSDGAPVFLHMPMEWTSARVSYQVSPDGTTFYDLFNNSAQELQNNAVAGTAVRLDPIYEPITWLRIRSGGRDMPVPQEADRAIIITVDTAVQPSI